MNRRQFFTAGAAGAAAACLASTQQLLAAATNGEKTGPAESQKEPSELFSICGLYCGICKSTIDGECHGCSCECGKCAGAVHRRMCGIAKCAAGRKLSSCSDCKDLPCTMLIQFANDPIWRTHAPVIENLRRRKAIASEAWLEEQAEFWSSNKEAAKRWLALYAECDRRHAEWSKVR